METRQMAPSIPRRERTSAGSAEAPLRRVVARDVVHCGGEERHRAPSGAVGEGLLQRVMLLLLLVVLLVLRAAEMLLRRRLMMLLRMLMLLLLLRLRQLQLSTTLLQQRRDAGVARRQIQARVAIEAAAARLEAAGVRTA